VLEGKVKHLRQQGKGKRPNSVNVLTAEEEEMLWTDESLGNSSPRVLSQIMWWVLTQRFGLRGRQEHHSMKVEDCPFCVDDCGTEYITFKEHPDEDKAGRAEHKTWKCFVENVLSKMFASGGPRCPVELFF